MAVYDISGTQEDCYPNTTVLRNRFHIQDQKQLSLVEQKLVTSLAAQLEKDAVLKMWTLNIIKGCINLCSSIYMTGQEPSEK